MYERLTCIAYAGMFGCLLVDSKLHPSNFHGCLAPALHVAVAFWHTLMVVHIYVGN